MSVCGCIPLLLLRFGCFALAAAAPPSSLVGSSAAGLPRRLAPSPTPVSVFRAGSGGYTSYCAPGLASNAAAFIVSAEAVGSNGGCPSSAGQRDLVISRSTDAGQSFGPLQLVSTSAAVFGVVCPECTLSDPTPLGLAIDSDAPMLLFATAARSAAERDAGQLDIMMWRSEDSGATWSSTPVNLTGQLGGRPLPRMAGGHGVRIMNGKFAGRLVVPVTVTYGSASPAASSLISEDGGATWRRGTGSTQSPQRGVFAEISWATDRTGAGKGRFPTESDTERVAAGTGQQRLAPEPGNLVAFLQDAVTPCGSGGPDPRCRWTAYSADGGDSWGPSTASVPDGGSPGSISQWWGGRGLLSVNARSPGGGNLTFFAQQDGGEGGEGSEVFATQGGAADVTNFIWLQVMEAAAVAWESGGGSISAVVIDPSTLIG